MAAASSRQLRAVVIGAGLAGEGHTKVLQHLGVQVEAICAREPEIVRAVADRLGVPQASTDWRRTLETHKPDIVTLATPAALRSEPIEVACELGCHILCEKPFATSAGEARRLVALVERARVKHAFAAIWVYSPATIWLSELVRDGIIGPLREVELTERYLFFTPLRPWTWVDSRALGGGALANGPIHHFAQLERIVGGPMLRVTGEARRSRDRAPYVPGIHDFRESFEVRLTPEETARLEWRECDADGASTALFQLAGQGPGSAPVQAVMVYSALTEERPPGNGWWLHGDLGTLAAPGDPFQGEARDVLLYRKGKPEPEALPVPQRLLDELPKSGDDLRDRWAALFRDFLADIRGENHQPYPTFREGWRYQEAIGAILAGSDWHDLPL